MGGILVFSLEASEPTLHVLVGLRKYGITTSNDGSPLRGKDFAFVDDVKDGQAALTCFRGEYLEVVSKNRSNVLEVIKSEDTFVFWSIPTLIEKMVMYTE